MELSNEEKASPIVNQVKIGSVVHDVVAVPYLVGVDPNTVGVYEFMETRISLLDSLNQKSMNSVLWHEIIHGINEVVCNHTMEESEVNMRASLLQQMIFDNPDLFLRSLWCDIDKGELGTPYEVKQSEEDGDDKIRAAEIPTGIAETGEALKGN